MNKVLVIGSKGFIGSHIFEAFSKITETWGCDIKKTESGKYFLINGIEPDYNNIFSEKNFDVCINCSGSANVSNSIKDPWQDYKLNTLNVFKMLEAIRQSGGRCKFINLSSAAVYGNPVKLPVKENDNLCPVSPYGLHKKQAEEICLSFYKNWNLETCVLRIFSAYGPGLSRQLFWDIYQKSKASNTIELFGTGNETRDFIYIDDIVNAILLVIQNANFTAECINVANGRQWPVRELTDMFLSLLKWKGETRFTNAKRAGDPLTWQADISLLTSMGYKQAVAMEEGLKRYVKWLKDKR